jgi:DNA primase
MSIIPSHTIDEVRLASDIVALVSDYVTLKKSGRNFFGLCPFHPEKSPSFSVNPEKQIFHCFGCGAGGNVFTFVQRQQGVSFPEAVRMLAKRAGIVIPEPEVEDAAAVQEKEALYFVHRMAAEFFQETLFSEAGRVALEYMKKRGFNEEALRAFGVGYAPQAWEALTQQARKKSVNPEVLVTAGLINRRDDNAGYYDRFRHRVMFPIHNLSGNVIAFGGRRIVDDESPKYVNSPETPIYHKGAILYGLYQGREAARKADRLIVVEGYLDVMRMHLCGFQNAVATSGTALTEDQARVILRYTKNVTLLYDSDTAGAAATLRGADILVENGLAVAVATLSAGSASGSTELAEVSRRAGDDPDSFLLKRPVEEMQQILQSAPPLLDFKILNASGVTAAPANPVEQRTQQLRSIVETLSKVRDGLERQALVHNMAERLHIDEALLWEEVSRLRRAQAQRANVRRLSQRQSEQSMVTAQSEVTSASSVEPIHALATSGQSYPKRSRAAEEELVRVMILYPEAPGFVFNFMRVEDFHDPEMRALAEVFYGLLEDEVLSGNRLLLDPQLLLHYFTEPRQAEFVSRVIHTHAVSAHGQEEIDEQTPAPEVDYRRWSADCMARLQILKVEEHIHGLREQLKAKEKSGGEVSDLIQEIMAYQEQRKRIRAENFLES